MTRPEHIRCENCCYWNPVELEIDEGGVEPMGRCQRTYPPPAHYPDDGEDLTWSFCKTSAEWFCGEFRTEWPQIVERNLAQWKLAGL